jgi:uncharacterized protein YaaW (UPF0174 family)
MPTKFVSNSILLNLLEAATKDELMALTRIVDPAASRSYDVVPLKEAICRAGGNGLANFFRGQGTGYTDILDDVADALEIKGVPNYRASSITNGLSVARMEEMGLVKIAVREKKVTIEQCIDFSRKHALETENKILIKLLEKAYANMNPDQRREFDSKVTEVARKFGDTSGKGLAGTAGLMVLGNLGGFATYTLMSTVLSTVTFGALGFGAYTAASSLLSLILGPVGWIAMGGAAVHAIAKPELKITIPLVANIAMIRQRVANTR